MSFETKNIKLTKLSQNIMSGFFVFKNSGTSEINRALNKIRYVNVERTVSRTIGPFSFGLVLDARYISKRLWIDNDSLLYIHNHPLIEQPEHDFLAKIKHKIRDGHSLRKSIAPNGACTLVYIDANQVLLATDRMGFLPVYIRDNGGRLIVSSSINAIKETKDFRDDIDKATILESLVKWTSRPPYTIYKHIKELTAFSDVKYEINKGLEVNTSSIGYTYNGESENDLSEQLASALSLAAAERTRHLDTTTTFLSGGFDSRAILANVKSRNKCALTVIDDEQNYECKIASKIALQCGVPHSIIPRDPDFYFSSIPLSANIIEGMATIKDCHFTPLINNENVKNADLLLSGCYADYLFKGLQTDRVPVAQIKRLKLPNRLSKVIISDPFWSPHLYLLDIINFDSNSLKIELQERLKRHEPMRSCRSLSKDSDYWCSEYHRLMPFSREPTSGTRLLLERTTNWCPILSDDRIIDMYCKIPIHFKINGSLWRKAISIAAPATASIRNANTWSKPRSNNFVHHFMSNLAASNYMVAQKIDRNRSVGSGQNFYAAAAKSGTWKNLTKSIQLKVLPWLGVSEKDIHYVINDHQHSLICHLATYGFSLGLLDSSDLVP